MYQPTRRQRLTVKIIQPVNNTHHGHEMPVDDFKQPLVILGRQLDRTPFGKRLHRLVRIMADDLLALLMALLSILDFNPDTLLLARLAHADLLCMFFGFLVHLVSLYESV